MNEGHSAFLTLELLREQHRRRGHAAEAMRATSCRDSASSPRTPPCLPGTTGLTRTDERGLPRFAGSLGMNDRRAHALGRVHPEDGDGAVHHDRPRAPDVPRRQRRQRAARRRQPGDVEGSVPRHGPDKVPIGRDQRRAYRRLDDRLTVPVLDPACRRGLEDQMLDAKFWKKRSRRRRSPTKSSGRSGPACAGSWSSSRANASASSSSGTTGRCPALSDNVLSPDVLTIGFARRFATYKRAPLFFRDLEWAIRILTNEEYPVQMIFAGKAHPRDDAGKRFIQEIVNITKRLELVGKVVFLEDYDINVARHLVSGADIWLNTPRRPMEASGTSGMKAIIHGGAPPQHHGRLVARSVRRRERLEDRRRHHGVPSEHEQDDNDAASLRLRHGERGHPPVLRPGEGRPPARVAEARPAFACHAHPGVQHGPDGGGVHEAVLLSAGGPTASTLSVKGAPRKKAVARKRGGRRQEAGRTSVAGCARRTKAARRRTR